MPMSYDEVCDLLAWIASYDRRTLGDADGKAWEAAVGDLAFADAQAAVTAHYQESEQWIKPVHVRQGVAAIRKARLDAAGPVTIPEELADDPVRAAEWKRATIAAIADGQQPPRMIASAS